MKPATSTAVLATVTWKVSATSGSSGSSSRIPDPDANPASASRPIGTVGGRRETVEGWDTVQLMEPTSRALGCPALIQVKLPGLGTPQPYAAAAIAAFSALTPAAGPSGWFQMEPTTARKSAPARTSGWQFSAVMPPMAQQGSSIISDHQDRMSGVARALASLVPEGKNAPKAT